MKSVKGRIASYITGFKEISNRKIPVISTRLTINDYLGSIMVRFDIMRGNFKVLPGLYGIGKPDENSPVFVTANYKLSFDTVRKNLDGIDSWLLVLDTKGINVWCSAGKGTFGTMELAKRIIEADLVHIVKHRMVILPQLGAVGVSAHKALMLSKFKVIYGTVRANDIKKFLAMGMKKDAKMSEVSFNWKDRLTVSPVEFVQSFPIILGLIVLGGVFSLPFNIFYVQKLITNLILLIASVFTGVFVFPLLLPFLPFKAFSLKGAVLATAYLILVSWLFKLPLIGVISTGLISIPVITFIAMNYTGSTTFTNQTGATLEVKMALPVIIAVFIAGIVLNILRAVNIFGG